MQYKKQCMDLSDEDIDAILRKMIKVFLVPLMPLLVLWFIIGKTYACIRCEN